MENRIIPLMFYCFYTFFVLVVFSTPVVANTTNSVTFSWQQNPQEDYVIGYRLYYGRYSRFDSSGVPKANYSYDYYIDFSELQRCNLDPSDNSCETLSYEELQCDDMNMSNPRCTVSQLSGQMFFAMTAYNAQEESGFTPELKVNLTNWAAILPAINLLLKNS